MKMKADHEVLRDYEPFRAEAHRAFQAHRDAPDPKTAIVVPDTNVLLAPYKSSTETLEAISRTYELLRKENRIRVPAQVAREFARNRSDLVAGVHKYVRDAKSVGINGQFNPAPILLGTKACTTAKAKLDEAGKALKAFKQALDELAETVAGWQAHDPVLEVYERIFDKSTVRELSIEAAIVEEIRKSRYDRRVPPGFKDKGKDDGGVGDLVIWLTMLEISSELGSDVIFVTEETKTDWFHRSGDERLFPRYELLEEFRNHGGRSFGILTLAQLLSSYGASPEVVEEVRDAAESPFWASQQAVGLSEHDWLVGEIAERIVVAGGGVEWGASDSCPDVFVSGLDDPLGVSAVLITQTGDAVYATAKAELLRAKKVAMQHGLTEHLVVFATSLGHVSRALNHWLLQNNHEHDRVAVVVARATYRRLRVVGNFSGHPFFRSAFAVNSGT